jgi:phosphate:Na+ symporter
METFESTIKKLSGHKLKTIVQDFTNTTFKSIFSGTLITGITQNSGIVSLLVLAFVSAGVMQLHNAIGVILGANL